MFKFIAIVLMAVVAFVAAKPQILSPFAYSAPVVAAAPASAVVSQEYHGNGFVSPYVAAAYSAPYVAAPAAYSASYVAGPAAYSAPVLL